MRNGREKNEIDSEQERVRIVDLPAPAFRPASSSGEKDMIGKVVRALAGRSVARRHGMSGAAGAAAGLLAPLAIKAGMSLISKAGHRAADARRVRKGPDYGPKSFTRL
jgi:hypothetical protein